MDGWLAASGAAYLRLNVASNERVFRDGTWQSAPAQYTQAVVFGARAEHLYNQQPSLEKGDEVVLRGHGLELLNLPTQDGCAVSQPMLDDGVAWVREFR